jgi:hypothetical protein
MQSHWRAVVSAMQLSPLQRVRAAVLWEIVSSYRRRFTAARIHLMNRMASVTAVDRRGPGSAQAMGHKQRPPEPSISCASPTSAAPYHQDDREPRYRAPDERHEEVAVMEELQATMARAVSIVDDALGGHPIGARLASSPQRVLATQVAHRGLAGRAIAISAWLNQAKEGPMWSHPGVVDDHAMS